MNQMQQQQNLEQVNVNQLMIKASSKKEIYNFLALDCEAYLPKVDTINVHFLKQIVRAQKDYVKRSAVKVAVVPQIEGLSVDDFIAFARNKPELTKFLPDERGWNHVDKKWICDIMYTIKPQDFDQMIKDAMKQRKTKLEQSQDQLIEMRPEFASALRKSISFSNSRGKSAFLLKGSSKYKRKRAEMEEVKGEEQLLKANKQQFLQNFKQMKLDKDAMNGEINELRQSHQALENLHMQGFIDLNAQPIIPQSQQSYIDEDDGLDIQSLRSHQVQ